MGLIEYESDEVTDRVTDLHCSCGAKAIITDPHADNCTMFEVIKTIRLALESEGGVRDSKRGESYFTVVHAMPHTGYLVTHKLASTNLWVTLFDPTSGSIHPMNNKTTFEYLSGNQIRVTINDPLASGSVKIVVRVKD